MSLYLKVLLLAGIFPLLLSFYKPLNFYRKPQALAGSILFVLIIFGVWDVLATQNGHWWFETTGIYGVYFLGLPLEEWLFFVVIPFTPTILTKSSGGLGGFLPSSNKKDVKTTKTDNFEENRTQLEQRISVIQQGLMRCGIRSVSLGTEETIELFYKLFNPGDTEKPIKL